MRRPELLRITTIEELRYMATAWDDLWRRSAATLPSLRAELLAQWLECFTKNGTSPSSSATALPPGVLNAPRKLDLSRFSQFTALVVEQGDRLVAALPLVCYRVGRLVPAGTMTANQWTVAGELLLDESDEQLDIAAVADRLVEGLADLPWPWLWLDDVAIDCSRWQAFLAAAGRAGLRTHYHERLHIGRIATDGSWSAYRATWSAKHRGQMARKMRRLEDQGPVELARIQRADGEQLDDWLHRGFEVEDLSWKGKQGTSVLRSGMFDFFRRQAQTLAVFGQLDLAFLRCGDALAAFSYGLTAKGTYHSYKVGYDPRFAEFSPGQLLRYRLFEELFADPTVQAIDYLAPTDAHEHWRPTRYGAGRLLVATDRFLGRSLLAAYRNLQPAVHSCRRMLGTLSQ